jgi:hypothetical protein
VPAIKRYQVFVSSTFSDLQDERQEVIQALLELDCIPAGMELFPAANDDQWTLIKRVIDDCDYYLVVTGGRYGSLGPDGVSFTEMEYRYAIDHSKPVIAFLHRDPGKLAAERCEDDPQKRVKLDAFRSLLQRKHCRYWESPSDLGSQVSRSLIKLIRDNPAVGWVKADQLSDEASSELLRLRRQVDHLAAQLDQARTRAPEGTEQLARGSDPCTISFRFRAGVGNYDDPEYGIELSTTWDRLFAGVAPLLIEESRDDHLRDGLNRFLSYEFTEQLSKERGLKGKSFHHFAIDDANYQTIKVQLRALGLIAKSTKPRSVRDTATYWTLTPFGDASMTKLRAIRRPEDTDSPTSKASNGEL